MGGVFEGGLFCAFAGIVSVFTRVGAEHVGVDWLWFSKDWGFLFICGFTLPFIYEGARSVRILWAGLLR
ncbi:hypothetical protein [Bartonella jaculi]|uniref:hypothetical protein n=1 Tax=Bartonella jaculi TaxID=686226 RepID=UPI0031F19D8B